MLKPFPVLLPRVVVGNKRPTSRPFGSAVKSMNTEVQLGDEGQRDAQLRKVDNTWAT